MSDEPWEYLAARAPVHCVICGFTTRAFPRPNPCPKCGAANAWGSVYAAFPKPDQAKAARKRYEQENRFILGWDACRDFMGR